MYIAGFDGGATKTACIIGDDKGNILSRGYSGPSNHQIVGKARTKQSIEGALYGALAMLNITVDKLDYTFLGLSGADMEYDFIILNSLCDEIFKHVPYKIVNDCWIGMRAGIPENYGIVSICGTGANTAGRNEKGNEVTLRALNYETGNRGGGTDIVRDALHFMYRSEEGTGLKTSLEKELPKLLGFRNPEEMVDCIRENRIKESELFKIPILVFDLANAGDTVCQDILINMGRAIGEMSAGVIKRLHFDNPRIPVILVGSVFKGICPLLIDEYTTIVHKAAPFAHIETLKLEPVMGAYFLGLDSLGIKL